MNIPKAVNLFSEEGHHAGFMLLAASSEIGGDCVFMLSPVSKEGVDSQFGMIVSELKVGGEHEFVCTETESGVELTVQPQGLPQVSFVLNHEFEGEVFTEFDEKRTLIGTAQPAKK